MNTNSNKKVRVEKIVKALKEVVSEITKKDPLDNQIPRIEGLIIAVSKECIHGLSGSDTRKDKERDKNCERIVKSVQDCKKENVFVLSDFINAICESQSIYRKQVKDL